MPVTELNYGRRQPRRHNYKSKWVRNDKVQDTGLVNGTMHYDKITKEYNPWAINPVQAATHNDTKPRNMVNGCANNDSRTKRDGKTPDYSSAQQHECNGSKLNGSTSPEKRTLCTTARGQEPVKLEQWTATKIQRKKNKPWLKKRNNHVTTLENCVPPQPLEDWEDELKDVKINNWEEISFGTEPYGPEDVVNFTLRDLSLEKTNPPFWQVTCNNYHPATHHRRPIEWSRYKPCSEPGQFSDVED
ncbi:hypothetical protein WMY93_006349 [Mugilogobius chulae]|uniref:Uncharacterized protein n=1 Tax=Mugilogobius chulae TaxID=88201 RepID=A0AAW0PMT2_9GOBI